MTPFTQLMQTKQCAQWFKASKQSITCLQHDETFKTCNTFVCIIGFQCLLSWHKVQTKADKALLKQSSSASTCQMKLSFNFTLCCSLLLKHSQFCKKPKSHNAGSGQWARCGIKWCAMFFPLKRIVMFHVIFISGALGQPGLKKVITNLPEKTFALMNAALHLKVKE